MKTKNTLQTVQSMRALAATLVVVFHCFIHMQARNLIDYVPMYIQFGRSGVDIFFVISGFIMFYVTRESFQKPGASSHFFLRRIFRIVPIYWFFTLSLASLYILSPENFSKGKEFSMQHLFASLAFIPWPNSLGMLRPTLGPGWTLNYEMYFYLLVAILLMLPKRFFLPLLSVLFLLSIVCGLIFPGAPPLLLHYTNPILIEFLFGAIAAAIFLNCQQIYKPWLLVTAGAILMLSSILVDTSTTLRTLKWGVPSFMILLGLVFWERQYSIKVPKLFLSLGDSSYSLYLSHIFSINLCGYIWFKQLHQEAGYLFVILTIPIALIIGHLSYRLLEKTASKLLNRQHASISSARSSN